MGGGTVLEDIYVPYHWPFYLPLYATTSSPGYYGFDVQSPDDRNHRHEGANEAIANINQVQTMEPDARKEDKVSVIMDKASVQLEGVETRGGCLSQDVEKEGGFRLEGGDEKEGDVQEGSVQPEEVEQEGGCQPEVVPKKEAELQPGTVGEEEAGSDEGRRAATVVQARYRGHLVRMTRPLVQLRAVAGIEAKLERLKQQAGSRAFQEELQKKKSMAKVGFEEGTLALLMELDKIQGSHPLVRQIRRSLVREIVDLQETVDALLAGIGGNGVD